METQAIHTCGVGVVLAVVECVTTRCNMIQRTIVKCLTAYLLRLKCVYTCTLPSCIKCHINTLHLTV